MNPPGSIPVHGAENSLSQRYREELLPRLNMVTMFPGILFCHHFCHLFLEDLGMKSAPVWSAAPRYQDIPLFPSPVMMRNSWFFFFINSLQILEASPQTQSLTPRPTLHASNSQASKPLRLSASLPSASHSPPPPAVAPPPQPPPPTPTHQKSRHNELSLIATRIASNPRDSPFASLPHCDSHRMRLTGSVTRQPAHNCAAVQVLAVGLFRHVPLRHDGVSKTAT